MKRTPVTRFSTALKTNIIARRHLDPGQYKRESGEYSDESNVFNQKPSENPPIRDQSRYIAPKPRIEASVLIPLRHQLKFLSSPAGFVN